LKNIIRIHIIIISILIFSLLGYSTNSVIIHNEFEHNTINKEHISFFEDCNRTYTSTDFISENSGIKFKQIPSLSTNFGFSKSAYWLKIEISNNTNTNQNYLATIAYPLINEINFYEIENNKIIDSIITGESYKFSTRKIEDRNFVFKMHIAENSNKTFLIRIYNSGETIRIPINIEKISEKSEFGNNETFRRSLYYGYILFALIFNLLMFFELRKKHYFLLSIFILSMSFFLFIIDGFAFQYFWKNSPYISNHAMIFF